MRSYKKQSKKLNRKKKIKYVSLKGICFYGRTSVFFLIVIFFFLYFLNALSMMRLLY